MSIKKETHSFKLIPWAGLILLLATRPSVRTITGHSLGQGRALTLGSCGASALQSSLSEAEFISRRFGVMALYEFEILLSMALKIRQLISNGKHPPLIHLDLSVFLS